MESTVGASANFGCGTRPTFLTLPVELRLEIYRFALCEDKFRDNYDYSTARNGQVLRVCWQIYDEARLIFYGENLWKLQMTPILGPEHVYFLQGQNRFTAATIDTIRPRIQHCGLKKFYVVIAVGKYRDVAVIKSLVDGISQVLSELPRLDLLHVLLRKTNRGGDAGEYCHVLNPFGLLKKVRRITLEGVPESYSQWLSKVISGDASIDAVPPEYASE
ncbi:hypothetical protein F4859DRAFT_458018 [Xylaria cf. heliscus]|nr:hypothetical protein F4859DRAFT_458018 [Xylaria cf. heliscus]